MKTISNHQVITTLDNPASIALAYNNSAGQIVTFPLPAGTPITNLASWNDPVFASTMCRGLDGTYYLVDVGPPVNLYTVNPTTGAVTLVGAITGTVGGEGLNGLSFNPANGMFYGLSSTYFYSVDINTRVATQIGSAFPITGLMIDLCFSAAGVCYAYEVNITAGAANGYTINTSTGAITALGYVGFTPNYGQGMGYDYETSTIYLSAYNYDTGSAQLRTMNPTNGSTTLITDWGTGVQIAPFMPQTTIPNPCPIGAPSNPNPPNGATNIPISGNTATWTNGSGTVSVEVWFGPAGNVVKVYDGALKTSHALPVLNYGTTYNWYIVCKDATCGTQGPYWSFSTMQDPNLVVVSIDIYPQNVNYWTGTCSPSAKTQVSLVNAGGTDVGWMVFDISAIVNDPTTVINSIEFNGYLYNNNFPYWSITPMGSVNPITADAATINSQVSNNYSQGTAYSYNLESGTLTNGWLVRDLETTAPTDMKNALGQGWFAIGLVDFDFSSTYYVYFQGWAEANRPYLTVEYQYVVPVELTSFTATADFGVVELSWITATETNNQGFEVQRSAGGEFETIAFIDGHGTTTEVQAYSYVDKSVNVGSYSYRLKQIDFDGTFVYSNVIEVDVPMLKEFALDQNYPNPFNPTTKIAFRLAVDSKVSLKVFDVLGQEVVTLVNANLAVGAHNIDFDASSLNSGVYLYRIEATGIDGTNFVDVKKMILTK